MRLPPRFQFGYPILQPSGQGPVARLPPSRRDRRQARKTNTLASCDDNAPPTSVCQDCALGFLGLEERAVSTRVGHIGTDRRYTVEGTQAPVHETELGYQTAALSILDRKAAP